MTNDNRVSSYLDYLPAIFQQDAFLGRFLLAFETLLSQASPDAPQPALEEVIEDIAHFFRPSETPVEFLPWLAGWVALSLREDWTEEEKRGFLSQVVPLYRLRGTKQGLEALIRIYTRLAPTIDELNASLQIGVHSTIGKDTILDAPHFFKVTIRLGDPNPQQRRRITEVTTAIIDMEKPAHTWYELMVETPTLQIGVHSTIGVDTLLGPPGQPGD